MSDIESVLRSAALGADGGVRHGFFTRLGGVSVGPFASLNCGFGSGDSPHRVMRNRAIALDCLGLPADRLVTARQVHGTAVVTVARPWRREEAPRADGLVTATPGIALGVLAADCAPILFHEPIAKVIGAGHAGWRGALAGITEAVVAQMTALGAERHRILAAIGPCIAQRSYEVGPEFPQPFLADNHEAAGHFIGAPRDGHLLFDLGGYLADRITRSGIATVEVIAHDTAAEDAHFFSYRRSCLRGERCFGLGLSAIVLEE
jgi:purine-nucleoside/S-methyl-5'-thioadenosine phosphorylase / adenosine deaminase